MFSVKFPIPNLNENHSTVSEIKQHLTLFKKIMHKNIIQNRTLDTGIMVNPNNYV